MKTKIYTKGGDKGETSLFGGPRVSKANPLLDGYGTVDELNAHIGLALSHMQPNEQHLSKTLEEIQNDLFVLGSHLACGDESFRDKLPELREARITDLEKKIDQMTDTIPELKEFILPGGTLGASHLHVCRTVCRRAERDVIRADAMSESGSLVNIDVIVKYLNRLSDFLFVAARFVNFNAKTHETKWKKP